DGNLIALPNRLAYGIAMRAAVLLVHRLHDAVLADHVVTFPDRLADGVAISADLLFVYGPVASLRALLEVRLIDRAVANARPVLHDGPIADVVADSGQAALGRRTAAGRITAGAAMSRPCRLCRQR